MPWASRWPGTVTAGRPRSCQGGSGRATRWPSGPSGRHQGGRAEHGVHVAEQCQHRGALPSRDGPRVLVVPGGEERPCARSSFSGALSRSGWVLSSASVRAASYAITVTCASTRRGVRAGQSTSTSTAPFATASSTLRTRAARMSVEISASSSPDHTASRGRVGGSGGRVAGPRRSTPRERAGDRPPSESAARPRRGRGQAHESRRVEGTPAGATKPATPQYDAGRVSEPAVWLPRASGTTPVATAAAEPLEEPPGVWARLCGFLVGPGRSTRTRW